MLDRLRRAAALPHPIWLHLGIVAAALAFGLPLCRRAIILSDEGYLLQQALDLLNGRVVYRDMDAFITPGMWFLVAGTFALLEPSVIASRVPVWIAYAALALVGFRIVAPLAGRSWGLAAVASLLLFSVWAFPAWTFAFYSPLAVLLALAGVERLLAWQRGGRRRDLVRTGVLLGLSVCFKQNYGVFALLGCALGWAAMRLEQRRPVREALPGAGKDLLTVAGGVVAAGLPFLLYLVWHGALSDAWQSLVVHPFEFGGRHDIPYAGFADLFRRDLYTSAVEKLTYLSYPALNAPIIESLHAFRGVHRMHVLLYWLAPLVLMGGVALSILSGRRRGARIDAALFTCSAACGLLYLGVLPRADFNHLVNVYQGVMVTAPLVLQRALWLLGPERRAARLALAGLSGLLALAYGGVALSWYVSLLRTHSTPLESPRAGVLVGALPAAEIDYQVQTIRRNTQDGEPVLTVPDLIMLNFLADRPVPSPYYNLYEHHIAGDGGRAVVEGSEAHGVRLVVTRYDNFFSDRRGLLDYAPELARYIVTHFRRAFVGANEGYIVYLRRDEPTVPLPHVDVLGACSEEEGATIRAHLLFSALYHEARRDRPIPEQGIHTRCRLSVPDEGGVLDLEVGYRKPWKAEPATHLEPRIAVEAAGTREVIYEERMRVVPRGASQLQHPYRNVQLDLSSWRGREIELVFETRLDGRVEVHPLDWKGFALVWRDPRLQARAGGARP